MKATLYADMRVIWSNAKMLFSIAAFLAVLAIAVGEIILIGVGIVLVSVSIPMSLCTISEFYGWDKLQVTTPIDRHTIAASHFVIGLTTTVVLAVGGLVAQGILTMVHPTVSFLSGVTVIASMVAVALVLGGVLLWASIRFGTERARYVMMIIVLTPTLGVLALEQLHLPAPDLSWLDRLSVNQGAVLLGGIVCLALAVYILFGFLSVRAMEKKEY